MIDMIPEVQRSLGKLEGRVGELFNRSNEHAEILKSVDAKLGESNETLHQIACSVSALTIELQHERERSREIHEQLAAAHQDLQIKIAPLQKDLTRRKQKAVVLNQALKTTAKALTVSSSLLGLVWLILKIKGVA
jgi:chromosome segregation ATPase